MPNQTSNSKKRDLATQRQRACRQRQRARLNELQESIHTARQEDVALSRLIQQEAHRVAHENLRLRTLLARFGVSEEHVQRWIVAGESDGGEHTVWQQIVAARNGTQSIGQCMTGRNSCALQEIAMVAQAGTKNAIVGGCGNKDRTCVTSSSTTPKSENKGDLEPCPAYHPPCKLISRLRDNPHEDLTQSCFPDKSSVPATLLRDGISCKEALEMVLPYATTEAKLESIGNALEAGCKTQTAGTEDGNGSGAGFCAVRKEVLWKLLDEVCID